MSKFRPVVAVCCVPLVAVLVSWCAVGRDWGELSLRASTPTAWVLLGAGLALVVSALIMLRGSTELGWIPWLVPVRVAASIVERLAEPFSTSSWLLPDWGTIDFAREVTLDSVAFLIIAWSVLAGAVLVRGVLERSSGPAWLLVVASLLQVARWAVWWRGLQALESLPKALRADRWATTAEWSARCGVFAVMALGFALLVSLLAVRVAPSALRRDPVIRLVCTAVLGIGMAGASAFSEARLLSRFDGWRAPRWFSLSGKPTSATPLVLDAVGVPAIECRARQSVASALPVALTPALFPSVLLDVLQLARRMGRGVELVGIAPSSERRIPRRARPLYDVLRVEFTSVELEVVGPGEVCRRCSGRKTTELVASPQLTPRSLADAALAAQQQGATLVVRLPAEGDSTAGN